MGLNDYTHVHVYKMYANYVAQVRSLGNEIPSYAVSVVWESQEPLLSNK